MIRIFTSPEAVLPALADFIVSLSKVSIEREGRFNLVLSGGNSPKRLYELLASTSYRNKIEWARVFFFFGDERYVPPDHKDSNFLMAKNTLFDPLKIADDHVFGIDTSLPPAESAIAYENQIRKHFANSCSFDLILLGLGDNSHTVSLFPHTTVLHERKALVKEIFVKEVNMYRITFTAPLINLAHAVAFLVYGESKAEAVHHILEDSPNVEEYPAQLIKPENGELHWYLDTAAAARIKDN